MAEGRAGVPPALPGLAGDFGGHRGVRLQDELGEVSTEEGAKEIGVRMEDILKKEGYYDGKKALLQ